MKGSFTRKIEDFTCNHCGQFVRGNGYTNHCPKCLWSLHVDISPGDRAAVCRGKMEPVGLEKGSGGYDIVHKCMVCGKIIKNRTAPGDDFDKIVELSSKV